ncbi:MAG: hypothetical protein QNJ46_03290 [Leptolyngbyaceae cyanobacterium MO_188.B28]|nr:hypothetical protein [Leptolyngbyaceae cyanobacterium MO_188.B28]
MKNDTLNTSLNPVNSSATQLVLPFTQPESQAIQVDTPSPISGNPSDSQDEALALVKKVKLQAKEMKLQKVQKKKKERVKAAFNLMDYIVKYYNTGETYISRAFTLMGMASLMMLGANQLTTVEGGLSAFVPPLDSFSLFNNLPLTNHSNSSETPSVSKTTPMESSFEKVTRLQPVLASPSFAPVSVSSPAPEIAPSPESPPAPIETKADTSVSAPASPSTRTPVPTSAPTPKIEPAAPSAPANETVATTPSPVENAPWVSPAPEIPTVSLPLPEVTAPLPAPVQEVINVVHQGVQQAAGDLNQTSPLPEISSPLPTEPGANTPEFNPGVQQAIEQIAADQLGQIASPSIPAGVDALPSIPSIPSVPSGIMGIFGGGDDD